MTPTRFIGSVLTALLLASPVSMFAQESSSASSQASSEALVITEDREFRLRGFANSIETAKTVDAQYRERRANFFKKRAQYRSDCRDQIRRANKTTLMKTTLDCYKNELDWMKDFAGKEKEELQGTAGLTPTVRSNAVNRVDLLSDAIGTVTFAIDSGVYSDQKALLEVKKNLYSKYEQPLWDTWMMVRADRALTWIAWLIRNIDQMHSEEMTAGQDRMELTEARTCLASQEVLLRPLILPDATDRGSKLVTALNAAHDCLAKIQSIDRILTATGSLIHP